MSGYLSGIVQCGAYMNPKNLQLCLQFFEKRGIPTESDKAFLSEITRLHVNLLRHWFLAMAENWKLFASELITIWEANRKAAWSKNLKKKPIERQ
ncbi:hypothetical protein MMC25_008048 [Agyrium rufum]|nr:hypothetical protein [Agyrium rufum]